MADLFLCTTTYGTAQFKLDKPVQVHACSDTFTICKSSEFGVCTNARVHQRCTTQIYTSQVHDLYTLHARARTCTSQVTHVYIELNRLIDHSVHFS